MAQGKKPSFPDQLHPRRRERQLARDRRSLETKNDKLHTGEIMVPLEALATGKLRIAIQAIEE